MITLYFIDCSFPGDSTLLSQVYTNSVSLLDFYRKNLPSYFTIKLIPPTDISSLKLQSSSQYHSVYWPLHIYPVNISAFILFCERIDYSLYPLALKPISKINPPLLDLNNYILFLPKNSSLRDPTVSTYSDDITYITSLSNLQYLQSAKPLSRHFNSIERIDSWYVKKSVLTEKLLQEFTYLKELPSSLATFFPLVDKKSYHNDENSASYKIETINGSDVASLVLSNNFTHKDSVKFYRFIASWLSNVRSIKSQDHSSISFSSFLCEKLISRLAELKNIPFYTKLVNSIELISLPPIEELEKYSISFLSTSADYLDSFPTGLYHGDLCLSNILYDNSSFYLIDPRGKSFSLNILYEFAKLRHSIISRYDFFNSENKSILINDVADQLSFTLPNSESYNSLTECYYSLVQTFNVDDKIISAIEMSLFLSMLPLHKDSPSRILRLYISSVNIYFNLLETS